MTSSARQPPPIARPRLSTRLGGTLATLASVASIATLATIATIATGERTAYADDKQVCVGASEKGQQLRSAGKLVEARDQFTLCGRAECPKLIQQDCTQWTGEVLAALPSVVPAAKDRNGRDIVDARLTIDGKFATDTLDGKPIVLDPGVHAFVFEAKGTGRAGAATLKEQVVVKPGEKNRIVTVTFATADEEGGGGPAAGAGTGSDANRESATQSKSSPPIAAYVFGALGVVALGTAGVMGLLANSDARDLRSTCAPNCKQGDVDAIQTRYTIGGVTAGVGGALLITGVVLFILHNHDSSTASSSATPLLMRF